MKHDYENAPEYDGKRFTVRGWRGIAFYILGWQTDPVSSIGCTGCDYMATEREHGGGSALNPHFADCPDDAELFVGDEPEYERTGQLLAVMVGDDRHNVVDPADLTELTDDEYCSECGQVGCTANAS